MCNQLWKNSTCCTQTELRKWMSSYEHKILKFTGSLLLITIDIIPVQLLFDVQIKTVYQAKPNQNVLQVRTPCWSSSLPGPDSRQQAWRNAEPEYATSFFSPEIELCTTSVNSRWPFLWSPSPILVSDLCFAKQGFTVPFTSRMSQEYGT
ncbi:hypothetical protein TB2_005574 [Malus domestica]